MKTISKKNAKNKNFDSLGFTTLNINELMKIRGGDGTTNDLGGKKIPD